MSQLIAILTVMAVSVASSVWVMMYGWGLQPKSWWWIIGIGFFFQVFLHVIVDVLKKESK